MDVEVEEVNEKMDLEVEEEEVEEEFHEDCGHSMFVFFIDSFERNFPSLL